ncbi:MAG: tyrosine-type recombinase/integrase [Planctomycetota bacterium]
MSENMNPATSIVPVVETGNIAPSDPIAPFLAGQLSPQTKRAYAADLRAFLAHVPVDRPEHVTRAHVEDWRNAMMEAGLSPSTIARRLSTVRAMFAYLVGEGVLDRNPAAHVRSPKVSAEGKPPGLTLAEGRLLLEQPNRSTLRGVRDYAILKLMLHTGIRRAELVNIKAGDFGQERGYVTLTVIGKGGSRRVIPLTPPVVEAIDAYRQASGRDFSDPEAYLFTPTRTGKTGTDLPSGLSPLSRQMSTQAVWLIVKKYADKAGLSDKVSPHSCRVAAVTRALDLGCAHRDVAAMTGHASVAMVERYDRDRQNLDRNAALKLDF